MNIALAITAARQGATIANHVRVTSLVKDDDGKITAVTMKDVLTGKALNKIQNFTGLNLIRTLSPCRKPHEMLIINPDNRRVLDN
jgi:hypothetical protein